MSWSTEDWTSGLSGRVLQRVQELQVVNEKLNRERQQRQLQLDNSEAALLKQKQKYEDVRAELAEVQRELLGVREKAQGEVRMKDRLTLEVQAKTAQLYSLEGQLDAAKTLSQNLALEVKRLQAELEKLQKETTSGDSMLFSTPCWNMSSPWEQGKSYTRGEGDFKHHQVRQQLQFGDTPKHSVGGVSSTFPQQTFKTPAPRQRVHQSETRTPSSVFPWEQDDTKPTPRGKPASPPPISSFSSSDAVFNASGSRDDGIEDALRKEIDGLRVRVSELQKELQLEKESYKQTQSHLDKALKELNTNEQNLTRSKDELARAHTRITQEEERTQAAEQRVKQLQEELKCQRQNAETSRCNAEQRRKEMEREHQRELLELQRDRQSMEKQHQQESNKLNQEIQQARTQHNTLQTQHDKLALQKQVVERDLEEVQGKLKNTQTELTETQKRETQLQAKLAGSLKENEGLHVSVEQLKKKEKSLEADVKRLNEELAEALKLIKELQAKLAALPVSVPSSFTPAVWDSCNSAHSVHHDYTPSQQHLVQGRKVPKPGRPREPNKGTALTYPSDREPGEGIDSEQFREFESADFPTLGISVQEGNQHERRSVESEMESSTTEQDTGIEDTDTDSYMSDSISERAIKDDLHSDGGGLKGNQDQGTKQDSSSLMQLKKENSTLRDELRDVKRELDQRLEDLETQRRAETEARTKLKQLSKKHSNQAEQHRLKAQELKEKESKLEAQLELEKRESARLGEMVASLEVEAEKRQKGNKREENEAKEELFKLKEVLVELNKKKEELEDEREELHKEREVLQSELLKEREEREEERKLCKANKVEQLQIEELQAELDRLKSSSRKDKEITSNMPLTYLQLGNQSNPTNESSDVFSSPKSNISFCDSANHQNSVLSKEANINLITDYETEMFEEDTEKEIITSIEKLGEQPKSTQTMCLDETTVIVLELEQMRAQRDRAVKRANKAQKKLEELQNQLTSQTQQLTSAFESQSKNIEDLLMSIQERDSALQRQGEELELLKAQKQKQMDNSTLNTEQVGISVDTVCDSEINKTSSTDEAIKQKAHLLNESSVNDGFQQSHVDDGMDESSNNAATSVKSHVKDVDTNKVEDMELQISNIHDKDSTCYTDNVPTTTQLLEQVTSAQQCTSQAGDTPTEDLQISVLSSDKTEDLSKFSPEFPENSSDCTSDSKPEPSGLQTELNEFAQLKLRNEQLTLQLEEFLSQDILSIKAENEQLKLQLNLMNAVPCLSVESDFSCMTNTEDVSVRAQAVGDSANLEGKVGISDSSEGVISHSKVEADNKHEESEERKEIHLLQDERHDVQDQLQLLTEQNKQHADEGCLQELPLLKANKQMKEHNSTLNTKQFSKSVDTACDSEINKASSTDEAIKQKAQLVIDSSVNDGLQHSHVDDGKYESTNNAATSVNSHMKEVDIKEDMELQISNIHDRDLKHYTDNTTNARQLLEQVTTAQQCRGHAVHKNTEDVHSSVILSSDKTENLSEFSPGFLENFTDGKSISKTEVSELHKALTELAQLKLRNKQLTLQLQEGLSQDILSIKAENEQLKLQLSLMNTVPCLSAESDVSRINNTEDVSVRAQAVGDSAELDGKVGISDSSEDATSHSKVELDEHEESENEICSSVQDELQVLQSQLQLLSEQNKQQAEELQLWRLSAELPGESMDKESSNNGAIILVQEEQLLLPCSPTLLDSLEKNSRRIVQSRRFGFEVIDQQREEQGFSGRTADGVKPVFRAKELNAEDNAENKTTDNLKTKTRTKQNTRTLIAISSKSENSDDGHDFAQLLEPTGLGEDVQTPEKQSQENVSTPKSQEAGLATTTPETKVMAPKLNILVQDDGDDEVSPTAHDVAPKNVTKQDNKFRVTPARPNKNAVPIDGSAALKSLNANQDARLEFGEVTDRPQAETKDVKCVCTQTDEPELAPQVLESYSSSQRTKSVLNSSTQTDPEQITWSEETELQEVELAESPPLFPVSSVEPEKLLFSSSFPIPANPAHLAERIIRNRSRMSAAYDDTEYEPYGLPEVVMKGFADIPSGPSCPYVLRRGLLGTDALPMSIRETPIKEAEEEIEP